MNLVKNLTKTLSLLSCAMLVQLASFSVLAESGALEVDFADNQVENLMQLLDKDSDGLISLKEAAGHAKLLEQFNTIDINEDGYISIDELSLSQITKG